MLVTTWRAGGALRARQYTPHRDAHNRHIPLYCHNLTAEAEHARPDFALGPPQRGDGDGSGPRSHEVLASSAKSSDSMAVPRERHTRSYPSNLRSTAPRSTPPQLAHRS
jgi:hypothetical protein